MKDPFRRPPAASLLAALVLASCGAATSGPGPSTVQPGAPGEPSRPVSPTEPVGGLAPAHTDAEVSFIRGMIGHHAQALEMTALVPARTTSAEVRLLAQRIEVSQKDEIDLMGRWLRSRGEEVPSPGAPPHHAAGGEHARMPGMLTEEELARLAAASGPEFDRLFLEFMIRHHEGALAMVAELFASPGAAQAGEMFQIASEIASDQRIEIERMRAMLAG